MVRYLDPKDYPEGTQTWRKSRLSPVKRLQHLKERNNILEEAATIGGAHELVLRLLDTRSRSMGELRQAIKSKGFSVETAEEVITRLRHVDLIDDAVLVRTLISDRFISSGKVGCTLVKEMRHKGLDPKTIEVAMETPEPDGLCQCALELTRKRPRTMSQVPRDAAFRRLAEMLARRGYSPSICTAVVAQVLEEREEE